MSCKKNTNPQPNDENEAVNQKYQPSQYFDLRGASFNGGLTNANELNAGQIGNIITNQGNYFVIEE